MSNYYYHNRARGIVNIFIGKNYGLDLDDLADTCTMLEIVESISAILESHNMKGKKLSDNKQAMNPVVEILKSELTMEAIEENIYG
tara:strand:- start:6 stop:263 length:258 start_codon:yes stop_codon:yes gene_type:complete